jgi:hypothetical protein
MLIIHALIACARLITPRRITASIQQIFFTIAVARANARWFAVASSAHHERPGQSSVEDEPTDATCTDPVGQPISGA